MLAGLEEISDGELVIDNTVVNEVAPQKRDIAMVFQNYALYPHLTVYDNMAYGLKIQKLSKAEIKPARQRDREGDRARGAARPQAQGALRRPAPARRHGPRDRARARRSS